MLVRVTQLTTLSESCKLGPRIPEDSGGSRSKSVHLVRGKICGASCDWLSPRSLGFGCDAARRRDSRGSSWPRTGGHQLTQLITVKIWFYQGVILHGLFFTGDCSLPRFWKVLHLCLGIEINCSYSEPLVFVASLLFQVKGAWLLVVCRELISENPTYFLNRAKHLTTACFSERCFCPWLFTLNRTWLALTPPTMDNMGAVHMLEAPLCMGGSMMVKPRTWYPSRGAPIWSCQGVFIRAWYYGCRGYTIDRLKGLWSHLSDMIGHD